ncbi:TolC family protein [Rhodanobacter sp. B04]|uniref:TolC family protein n=1 Tax=Rhodanobacter sp. B04 TaxID=1945860 RepID=UPI00143B537A|nr:TolC family protein [Rhodanobacter sp. B04]
MSLSARSMACGLEQAGAVARKLATRLGLWSVGALLGGCATYHALPLPEPGKLPAQLAELRGAPAAGTTLDVATIERLVLLNNPDLRRARAEHKVAQAQMLQAGLLPNPALNGSLGYLISGAGDSTAWTAGISEDIRALVTLAPRRAAAQAAAAQVDASLLWQEWLTVGQARLLVVDLVEGERLAAAQQHSLGLLQQRSERMRQSMADGNHDLATAAPDLAAAADAQAAADDLQRRLLGQRHALNALLGLAPDAVVPMPTRLDLPAPDTTQMHQQIDTLPRRRPDLVALQLGYQAQEATLRAAVLAQFPALSFGYSASQDNSRVRNGGPAISFELPIFDRNQGNIAIAKATRQQLHDEYRDRLNSAHGEIDALLAEQVQARAQLAALQQPLHEAANEATHAEHAWQAGLIDLRSYVDLVAAAQARQSGAIALEQAVLEQQVAIDTLVGAGMPASLPQEVIAP